MRRRFEEAVRATLRRRALLADGQHVAVACSGGADSTALACVLHALGHAVTLVTVDHRSRPDVADDVAAVAALAATLGGVHQVLCVPEGTPPTEADWRHARYALLDGLAHGPVALGHTRDDQAETVLMRVVRGAGTHGLAGIPPQRGRYVRPLIDRTRAEVVAYLAARGQPWREDPTNAEPRFARNRIRTLLGALSAEDPQVGAHLAALADAARDDRALLDGLADAHLAAHGLGRRALLAAPRGLQAHVVRRACPVPLSHERTATLLDWAADGTGAVQLGHGVAARWVGRGREAALDFVLPG